MKPFKFLLLLLLLPACAQWHPSKSTDSSPSALPGARQSQPQDLTAQVESAKTDPSSPKLRLTPEWLFGILASEIAVQRGVAGSAAVTYLALARETRDPRMAQRASELALLSGQLPTASDALQLWIATDPASIAAREQWLITLWRLGNLTDSLSVFHEILRREPSRAAALFMQLARLTEYQTDKAAAYVFIQTLANHYSDLPEAQFALSAAAAAVGDDKVVDKQFDRLANSAPQWDLPVAWQTERLNRQDPKVALFFLEKELARRPEAGLDLKMAYPRLLLAQKKIVDARAAFEALLKYYPRHPDLLYACGLLAYQLKDVDGAKKDLQAALDEQHADPDIIRLTLAQIAEDQQEDAIARHWYQQVQQGKAYLSAQVRLATLDAKEGSFDSALSRLNGLGSTEQERVQLALLQSQLAREAKRYDLAYAVLGRTLQLFPKTPELLYERAIVSDMRGNVTDAERDLKQFLREKPDDPMGLNALGYTLANRTNRHYEALALIEKAFKAAPDNPMILDSMGWVQYKLGHFSSALKYLSRAYTSLEDPEVAAHYGEVLWKLGRRNDAREVWEKASLADPDNEALHETMRRLLTP